MTDADELVQAFYGRWARLYDRIATLPPASDWRDRTAESLGLEPGGAVVEMGCGTGANLPFLRERVGPDGTVVGLDLTRGMLERARARGRESGGLVQGDATRPPFREAATEHADPDLDALLATFVVAMVDDPAAVVNDWCDLVGPGDRVGLLHFHASDRWWAPPANALYRTLVRVSSPDPLGAAGAAADHDARVRAAHVALEKRATIVDDRSFAGGFVRLVVGRLPEE